MEHIKIIQNNTLADTEEVSKEIIQKLYDLAVSGDLDASSEMKGRLHLTAGYRAQAEYLHQMFPNLIISADTYIIPFEDPKMVTYLNSIGVDSNGVVTENDAVSATIVANSQNTEVTKFNELKYFTSITESRGGLSGYDSGYVRFAGWTALEEVDISNFTSIGHNNCSGYEDTFNDCSSLKKVTASNKLHTIGWNGFSSCKNLEEVSNLDGTITVYGCAFFQCWKLKNQCFDNVEVLFPATNGQHSFFQTKLITSLTLSNACTNIPFGCFEESSIETINIPQNVVTINDAAFKNSKINSIDLSNVTTIGIQCFYGCSNLTTINISSGVTTLPNSCFQECSNLTSINLSNITLFDNNCLNNCRSLTASDINWTNVTKIGEAAFNKVRIQQQNLVIPNLTDLGSWPFGNDNSSGITSVDFTGSTFTWLNPGLFEGHSSIDHVTMPASLTTIDGWGHFRHTSVRWIKFLSTSTIAFYRNATAASMGIPSTTKIYVPDTLVNDYQSDTKWSAVANQIFPMSQFSTDFPNG